MFVYTRATIDKIVNDLKRATTVFNFSGQLVYISYLIYAIFAPVGLIYINVPLLVASVLYFAFYLIYFKKSGSVQNAVKHSYKWIKITAKAFTLGVTLYGIYTATTHITSFSVILTTLMIIVWIVTLAIEITTLVVEYYAAMFKEALAADVGEITKPVQAVGNVVKKIVGIEAPSEPKNNEPSNRLKKLAGKFREKKARQKSERKAALSQQRQQRKEAFRLKGKGGKHISESDNVQSEKIHIEK